MVTTSQKNLRQPKLLFLTEHVHMYDYKERPATKKRKRARGSTNPDELDRPWNIAQLRPFYS